MNTPTTDDQIIHLLKGCGAGFHLVQDGKGIVLKSKLFADEEAAREILAEINSSMPLHDLVMEEDAEGSGWYLVYPASATMKPHFSTHLPPGPVRAG